MTPLSDEYILGTSASTVTLFEGKGGNISHKSERVDEMEEGDSILCLKATGDRVLGGSECGYVYT